MKFEIEFDFESKRVLLVYKLVFPTGANVAVVAVSLVSAVNSIAPIWVSRLAECGAMG